jgi:hypothetical protein
MTVAGYIAQALRAATFTFTSEAELQDGIALALQSAQIVFTREVRLTPRNRIDFFVAGGTGIEVKVDGSLSALVRQLHRYAELENVRELVVVTSLIRLSRLPPDLCGKPITAVCLARGIS